LIANDLGQGHDQFACFKGAIDLNNRQLLSFIPKSQEDLGWITERL